MFDAMALSPVFPFDHSAQLPARRSITNMIQTAQTITLSRNLSRRIETSAHRDELGRLAANVAARFGMRCSLLPFLSVASALPQGSLSDVCQTREWKENN